MAQKSKPLLNIKKIVLNCIFKAFQRDYISSSNESIKQAL